MLVVLKHPALNACSFLSHPIVGRVIGCVKTREMLVAVFGQKEFAVTLGVVTPSSISYLLICPLTLTFVGW